jgi:hypothetical protein
MAGEGEPGADGLGGVGGEGVAKDEDGPGDAGLSEHVALMWPHNRETVGTCRLERRRQRSRPGAVGVRLHDGDQLNGAQGTLERSQVGPRRIKVDLDPAVEIAGDCAQRALCSLRRYQLTGPFPPAGGPFDQPARANLASDW